LASDTRSAAESINGHGIEGHGSCGTLSWPELTLELVLVVSSVSDTQYNDEAPVASRPKNSIKSVGQAVALVEMVWKLTLVGMACVLVLDSTMAASVYRSLASRSAAAELAADDVPRSNSNAARNKGSTIDTVLTLRVCLLAVKRSVARLGAWLGVVGSEAASECRRRRERHSRPS